MVVGGKEDDVENVIVGNELEEVVALSAVAAHPGLAAVAVDGG